MPNYNSKHVLNLRYRAPKPPKKKLNMHLNKSQKRDHIYTCYIYMLEEHNC